MNYKGWLHEWFNLYVLSSTKDQTSNKYYRLITKQIIPKLGDYKLEQLTPQVLQKFVLELSQSGFSSNTIKGIISLLKNSLKKALQLGIIEKEFTSIINYPKTREKKIECLTLQEQRKLENYIINSSKTKLSGIVICLYTGLRIGELLSLKWDDLDLIKGTISVEKTCYDSWKDGRYIKIIEFPKTKSSQRTIPIPKQILPYIKKIKKMRKSEYVVEGRSIYGAQIRSYQKTFQKLLQELNIPHHGFHSLRHTFATRALECGMDVKTLSELLGHHSPTVTLTRYAHSMLEHKIEMMNKLGELWQ